MFRFVRRVSCAAAIAHALHRLRLLLPIALAAATSACIQAQSYVDPAHAQATRAPLPLVATPRPTQLLFEFRTKGNPNAAATEQLRPRVFMSLSETRAFSEISSTPAANGRTLAITLDNVPLTDDAAARGFGVGLTFGLVGAMVTDGYAFDATLSEPGRPAATRSFKHAIHSTIGNAAGPPGLQPVTPSEAINQVVDELVRRLVGDLTRDGAL
jgi:hypothetical protein